MPNTPALWEEYDEIDVVDVVVDIEAPELQPTYSYRVPITLRNTLHVGACVHVPFGGREALGFILARRKMKGADPVAPKLRDVIGRVEGAITFSPQQAHIAEWITDRYVCDLSSAVRCVAPAAFGARVVTVARLAESGIRGNDLGGAMVQAHIVEALRSLGGEADIEQLKDRASVSTFAVSYAALVRRGVITELRQVSRAKTTARKIRAYRLGSVVDSLSGRASAAGERILAALAEFERSGESPVLPEQILARAQASTGALKTLVEKGAVVMQEIEVRRAPHPTPAARTLAPVLTEGQQHAAKWISEAVDSGTARTALLFGVTASGKTEVYLDAIGRTLKSGRNAIVLVPEIALTAQVVEVFTGRFGDEVAVLHSRLSGGERYDEWRRLQEGRARIAVGARSAVFAPVDNIGLIVVDEEHEASYKQETMPRYNARDVARERARKSGATLVLGSATPSLETFFAAEARRERLEEERVKLLQMPERIDSRPLPGVTLIDMREELREHKSLFSRQLVDQIGSRLDCGEQVILFLNRRGYSQFVLCRDCGYVARCPNCAVSLAFHAAWGTLKCHHCDYGRTAPTVCPSCHGVRIRGFGIGTERVEEEVFKHFPDAGVARMDRDTTSRKGAHAGILRRFREGEADILIGTQMVAKGLDFPNVTLVGVISADTSINMPDFRAAERTFQLLTQVAGRAGRGPRPGEVLIQTFGPDHYSLQMAQNQDYVGFFRKEISFRKELNYPPFSRFANLICTDEQLPEARRRAHAVAAALKSVIGQDAEVIGPAAAPLSRLKSLYRWHVVLRAPVQAEISDWIRTALAELPTADRARTAIDVDPMSMA